jgi:hypothetical protein
MLANFDATAPFIFQYFPTLIGIPIYLAKQARKDSDVFLFESGAT